MKTKTPRPATTDRTSTTVEVSPTGVLDQDAANIQAALDGLPENGTLILKAGTFELGSLEPMRSTYHWDPKQGVGDEKKFVTLRKSVAVKGERGPQGQFLTRVSGGVMPFCLGWDPALGILEYGDGVHHTFPTLPAFDYQDRGPLGWTWTEGVGWTAFDPAQNTTRFKGEFVIEDLWFDRFTWAAIYGAACDGVEIRNNHFTNGYKYAVKVNGQNGEPEGYCAAIYLSTDNYYDEPTVGKPEDLSGEIVIEKNLIECGVRWDLDHGYDPTHGDATFWFGTPFYTQGINLGIYAWHFADSVRIQGNQILNGDWALIRGHCGAEGATLDVLGNTLTAVSTDPAAPSLTGSGKLVFWGAIQCNGGFTVDPSTSTFVPYGNRVRIEDNDIQHRSVTTWLNVVQLGAGGPGSTVSRNKIHTEPDLNWPVWDSSAPIRLYRPQDLRVTGNTISGRELDGIWAQTYVEGDGLEIADNDLSNLITDRAQIGLLIAEPGANAVRESVIARNAVGKVAATGIIDAFGNQTRLAGIAIAGESNTMEKNDYRSSAIAGIADGLPCLLLTTASRDNTVHDSGGYPKGTNAKDQVLDLGTGNRVVGHSQDTLAQQEGSHPGIGKRKRETLEAIAKAAKQGLDRRGRIVDRPESLPKLPRR